MKPYHRTRINGYLLDLPIFQPETDSLLMIPLARSKLQRTTFMTNFVHKLQKQKLLNSTRTLSILGRSNIANSLISPMCWYLLRVTPVLKLVINKTRSVVSQFQNKNVLLRIKWRVLTLPKQ